MFKPDEEATKEDFASSNIGPNSMRRGELLHKIAQSQRRIVTQGTKGLDPRTLID
jgi:hypothetical protein